MSQSPLHHLVESALGAERAEEIFALMVVHPELDLPAEGVNRAVMAQALNMVLFSDLLARVPAAQAYADDCRRDGRTIFHDHGAVRTVVLEGMGALPSGEAAVLRVLKPLGYRQNGLYPLDRLKMTGRSYAHLDYREDIAQFFVSELHTDRFSPAFVAAAQRVTASSGDPLTPAAQAVLQQFQAGETVEARGADARRL